MLHRQLQGRLGNVSFLLGTLPLWKNWGKEEGGNRYLKPVHLYLRTRYVPALVLCSFCALSPLILKTTQGGGGCPHFVDEEPQTREVRDLPKVTQLLWAGASSWIQVWLALILCTLGLSSLRSDTCGQNGHQMSGIPCVFEESLIPGAHNDSSDLHKKGLCHLSWTSVPCMANFSEWHRHWKPRNTSFFPTTVLNWALQIYCDRSPDLRSHVLHWWECKETGRRPKNTFALNPVTY